MSSVGKISPICHRLGLAQQRVNGLGKSTGHAGDAFEWSRQRFLLSPPAKSFTLISKCVDPGAVRSGVPEVQPPCQLIDRRMVHFGDAA